MVLEGIRCCLLKINYKQCDKNLQLILQTGSNARGYTVMHCQMTSFRAKFIASRCWTWANRIVWDKKKIENPRVDSIEFVTLSCHSSLANNVQNCLKWNSTWIGKLRSELNLIFVIFNNNKLVRINNECKQKIKI